MASINAIATTALLAFKPPEKLTLSEWADRFAYLSVESSAEGGRWHTLPYQKGIMDAITDPKLEQITVMKSALRSNSSNLGERGVEIENDVVK